MHEGVEPRFLPDADLALLRERIEFAQQQPKIVVRKTFVEMDEEDDEEEDEEFRVERNTRRLKTSSHLRHLDAWLFNGQPPRGGAAVSAEVPQAPQENMHDGNICADDEEYFEDLCYLKCSLATKGTHPIRTSAFTCCKSEPCSFDNTEINMSPCDGFDVSGNVHGQRSACPHGEGTCLEDEELLLGMCYKKCSILTEGRFNHRVAATTCCSETGLACFNPMNLKTDFVGFAVGGGKGDGSQATPSVPHLPMKELTEKGWKAPKQEVPTAVPAAIPVPAAA
eukprot:s4138_g3.t1